MVYVELDAKSAATIAEDTRSFARQISRVPELAPIQSLLNPVIAYEFYLSLIFLMTPLPDGNLRKVADLLHGTKDHKVAITADAVISTLIRDGLVRRTPIGLETTQLGQSELLNEYQTQTLKATQRKVLNRLRSHALNVLYRGRNRTLRGGAITWSTR